MPNIKQLIDRCNEIIQKGENVLSSHNSEEIKKKKVSNINSSIENIYNLCYPNNIPDHLKLGNYIRTLTNQRLDVSLLDSIGIFVHRLEAFKGFKEDLEKGLITTDLIGLISVDVFSDIIDQAKNLRESNTEFLNRAACVLTRIVLEDTLKKLCSKRKISLTSDKASVANDELKRQSVYPQTMWRQVQAWLDIGNAAAHPMSENVDFNKINETQIDNMINGVKDFVIRYL